MAGGKRQKKRDGIKREAFTTNLDSELLHEFRIYCVTKNVYQNDILEQLIRDLLKGSGEVGNTDK